MRVRLSISTRLVTCHQDSFSTRIVRAAVREVDKPVDLDVCLGMFNVECVMYNVECVMYNVECVMCSAQCIFWRIITQNNTQKYKKKLKMKNKK